MVNLSAEDSKIEHEEEEDAPMNVDQDSEAQWVLKFRFVKFSLLPFFLKLNFKTLLLCFKTDYGEKLIKIQ